jgi:hypothetical protein
MSNTACAQPEQEQCGHRPHGRAGKGEGAAQHQRAQHHYEQQHKKGNPIQPAKLHVGRTEEHRCQGSEE